MKDIFRYAQIKYYITEAEDHSLSFNSLSILLIMSKIVYLCYFVFKLSLLISFDNKEETDLRLIFLLGFNVYMCVWFFP